MDESNEIVDMINDELNINRDEYESLILCNGRSLLQQNNDVFTMEDYKLFANVEADRAGDIDSIILDTSYTPPQSTNDSDKEEDNEYDEYDWRSNAVFVSSAFIGQYTQESRIDISEVLEVVNSKQTLLDLSSTSTNNNEENNDNDNQDVGTVSIVVVMNPLSEAAQRVSPLLLVLRDELKLPLKILLIPEVNINEFPLSKFYRYVVSSDIGNVSPIAQFNELPSKHVLTMRMDVPEPWNVQSSKAIQDVDNLKCDAKLCGDKPVSSSTRDNNNNGEDVDLTQVEYTLKSILLAGQCFDPIERRPPNGLQLTLTRLNLNDDNNNDDKDDKHDDDDDDDDGKVEEHDNKQDKQENDESENTKVEGTSSEITSYSSFSTDTVVMQNLGYFQLQASPGVFDLTIAPGRGRELYSIMNHPSSNNNDDENNNVNSKRIVLSSFHDMNVKLKVKKNVGKEHLSLLKDNNDDNDDEDNGSGGLFSSIGNMFKTSSISNKKSTNNDDDTIHVFSLATGHLYERFLKIMMLSVVKRSSQHVKFWLFENFLSPTFKDSAIAMSKEYNFDIGFVSYKWPSWLRQQSSKQRIIWGYKILFLDVLFPLNVKKVIYVDSDQTVRGDLAELWNLDLNGKPYAYVPFCDSRKETLGYQFWRQGYWKDHLNGKPYHISALYVVDLDVFRKTAVGDQLRALYDNLSRDPNSLANLDQDLPNYAQSMIPIFSLPQEWLWCESWCSDKTKKKAKTIDLCNNPMHKEPKLDMAKRVISGELFKESWVELDDEIKALEDKHHIGLSEGHEAEEASLDMGFG
jgi:UDP-glucose:glycoprotein glucosyltransferase